MSSLTMPMRKRLTQGYVTPRLFPSRRIEAADTDWVAPQFVGYVSDVAAGPVSIFAIEADVCTGEPIYRQIASAAVDGSEPRNKFQFRFKQPATSRYTREYRLVASGGTKLTKNQIDQESNPRRSVCAAGN